MQQWNGLALKQSIPLSMVSHYVVLFDQEEAPVIPEVSAAPEPPLSAGPSSSDVVIAPASVTGVSMVAHSVTPVASEQSGH